jgi:hypothetical protein
MNSKNKLRLEPLVTYRPKLTTMSSSRSEYEIQCIQTIADRDLRIAALEYALKEVERILIEEPAEIGTAIRIIKSTMTEEES